ncbi:hypothetical protein [Microbacterium sp. PAMC21962]|uniref:hypothetical protein n=1 Tax=Microbacterium sp. PAMC21962 TaxID=2861280 RepID=UPI001C637FF9|nr:hypothetical protein [Microbacterium sp. PAMC21962]QYF98494.1 hypothetical protein KY498_04405 [Microbacterium sp. PAMC21962]
MSEFTASNGVTIHEQATGTDRGKGVIVDGYFLPPNDVMALREFFQKENDDRLGRWRWREDPDYVVYPLVTGLVAVVEEKNGTSGTFSRIEHTNSGHGDAARAYFLAHPDPKPWDEAKPGEVWVFTLRDAPELSHAAVLDDCATWTWTDGGQVDLTTITSGRRIWPEVAS